MEVGLNNVPLCCTRLYLCVHLFVSLDFKGSTLIIADKTNIKKRRNYKQSSIENYLPVFVHLYRYSEILLSAVSYFYWTFYF